MMALPDLAPLLQSIRTHVSSIPRLGNPRPGADTFGLDAAAYTDACDELNQALAEVAALIDRGLRHEAIELANAGGDLKARYEQLFFPELPDWIDLLLENGLPVPYELDHDAASKLEQANQDLIQRDSLIRQNRIHALARSPLVDRIRILDALVRQDSGCPAWQADLVVLQRARLVEIQAEIDRSVAQRDLQTLGAIQTELSQSDWWVPIPPEWTAQIDLGVVKATKQKSLDRLRTQVGRLQEAYAAFDVDDAAIQAKTVRQLMKTTAIADDDPLADEIHMAFAWIDEQQEAASREQRRIELLTDLEQTLQRNAPKIEIEQSLAAAESLGEGLPLPLRVRARERLESFELVARRKTIAAVSLVAMVLIAAATGIGYVIIDNRRILAEQERDHTFSKMVKDQRYEDAKKFLAGLSDQERKLPLFVDGLTKIEESDQGEVDRKTAFQSVLNDLHDDLSGRPNYALVSRLRKLAKEPSEQNIVALQEARAEEMRLRIRAIKSTKFGKEYDALQTTVNASLDRPEINKTRPAEIQALQRELRQFGKRVHISHPELAHSARQLDKLLSKKLSHIQRGIDRQSAIDLITRRVGDVPLFVSAIESFRERFPEDSLSAAFGDSGGLSAKTQWLQREEQWGKIFSNRVFRQPKLANAEQTTSWLKQIDKANQFCEHHPYAPRLEKLLPFYEKITKRPEAIKQLRTLHDLKWMHDVYLYSWNGVRYYSPDSPNVKRQKQHRIDHFVDLSLQLKQKYFGPSISAVVNSNARLSGQSKYSLEVKSVLDHLRDENFTGSSYKMLKAIHDTSLDRTDPICKLFLVHRMLVIHCEASESVERGFGSIAKELRESDFLWDTNWLSNDRHDADLIAARNRARRVLSDMGDWTPRLQQVRQEYTSFLSARRKAPEWIGWVAIENGKPIGVIRDTGFQGQAMILLTKDSSVEVIDVGSIEQGKLSEPLPQQSAIAGLAIYQRDEP